VTNARKLLYRRSRRIGVLMNLAAEPAWAGTASGVRAGAAGIGLDRRRHEAFLRGPSDLLAPVYGWFTEGFDTLDLNIEDIGGGAVAARDGCPLKLTPVFVVVLEVVGRRANRSV